MASEQRTIKLLTQGRIEGEATIPEHIESLISNVFIFPDRVYKIYKADSPHYPELADTAARFAFTKEDFAWNRALSPSIHLRLQGIKATPGKVAFVDEAEAEELAIVMQRVPEESFLSAKLRQGDLTEEDAYQTGAQVMKKLNIVQRAVAHNSDFAARRVADFRSRYATFPSVMPEEEWAAYCDRLERYHEAGIDAPLATIVDMHAHNVLYREGVLELLDTYPPKEEWAIDYALMSIYRLGMIIKAYGNDPLYRAFLDGASVAKGHDEAYFLLYVALIEVSYRYQLAQVDPGAVEEARRFHSVLREIFATSKD